MKYTFFAIILIVFHLFLLSRLQFTAWPEMFSYPYLLSHGFNLYKDIALPYQPLLPVILEMVYKIFGYSLSTLQILTYALIIVNDILIFAISVKLIGKKLISLLPVALYIPLQAFTEGNMLWFDLATTPFILLAIYFFLTLKKDKNFFWLGFFLSFAFFIKQQIGIIYLFLIIFLIFGKKFREIYYLIIGSAILSTLILLYIVTKGIFRDWIFWSIEVPFFWYPKFPSYSNWPSNKEVLVVALLYGPAVLSTIFVREKNQKLGIIIFSFIGAFISAFPRFEFFRFQPALIFNIILISFVLSKIKLKLTFLLFIPLMLSIIFLFINNRSLFNLGARFYGERELKLAKEINNMTRFSDRIFILNESSAFYVLSDRLPPKPWVDNYVWYMEIDGMQEKVLDGFKHDPPEVIFRRKSQLGNWFDLGTYEPKKVVEYIEKNYHKRSTIEGLEIWTKN